MGGVIPAWEGGGEGEREVGIGKDGTVHCYLV